MDINGDWSLNGQSRSLSTTDAVPVGGKIALRKPTFGSPYIVIADRNGRKWKSKHCHIDDCSQPIILPKTVPGDTSALSRVFRAVMSFWSSKPDEFDAQIIRTGGSLRESVITLTEARLDLHEVFKDKQEAKYLLRFVSKGKYRLVGIKEIDFDWHPEAPSALIVPKLKPGLYEIDLLSLQDREPLEAGEEVWILVVAPGKYHKRISQRFKLMLAHTAEWESRGLGEARRSFLRAYLAYLDGHPSK